MEYIELIYCFGLPFARSSFVSPLRVTHKGTTVWVPNNVKGCKKGNEIANVNKQNRLTGKGQCVDDQLLYLYTKRNF